MRLTGYGTAARIGLAALACNVLVLVSGAGAQETQVPTSFYRYYAGISGTYTHHTGYVPATRFAVEKYIAGFNVFGGYRVFDWLLAEIAYHHLGQASFLEGGPTPSREESHAVAASLIYISPPSSEWWIPIPAIVPTHFIGRVGVAYKNINHVSAPGSFLPGNFNEGIASWVIGAGIEMDLTDRIFARVEYEFISKAFYGTNRVVNVQHTPISASVGVKF